MSHLTDEEVLTAARAEDAEEAVRTHLGTCSSCTARVEGAQNLASALRAAEPEVRPPSFDALVAPALAEERARPAARAAPDGRALTAAGAARLAGALVLRQAKIVPAALWPLAGVGLAALIAFVRWAPDPTLGAFVFGPGVTLLTTAAALAVSTPGRDPRAELMYTLRVPPAAVWLARLVFVVGAVLAAAAGASAAAAAVSGAPLSAAALIASWLGPTLLGTGLAVFGTVWRSPAVGASLGSGSWLMSMVATRAAPLGALPPGVRDSIGALWTTTPVSLAAATALFAAAAWLVSRPDRSLRAW
ncbi:hypothetical protein O4J56_28035 [Nocardiopsis sp. RSe5-2]|uniref:Zf-HC2 domain-containing protein n=1 Tax=Nocardiopsis endophytica TaxID=3018445 RepID=A0ABT4UC32_9ACTN|nr:hypothetical protein [Nocardiopsis endophytica]MDA2814526.1 hypothetical protein [Nocardiopsis endophytica]